MKIQEVCMTAKAVRPFKILIIMVAVLFLTVLVMDTVAHARAGGGRTSGSSGMRSSGSYQRTAPTAPTTRPTQPSPTPTTPTPAPAPSFGRSLMYGIGGGLLGGMLGSMLFGGAGHAGGGGWGGGGGFGFGDLIIILIILGVAYYFFKRYKARKEMEASGSDGSYGSTNYAYSEPGPAIQSTGYDAPPPGAADGIKYIAAMDPAFTEAGFKEAAEDNFFRIQGAWTKRDLAPIRALLAPQMLGIFQEQVNQAAAAKQFNKLENIAVRQVEIVDAVQDQGQEYITVKFLASLLDYTVEETTNQVVAGSSSEPVKFLEYWTFTRRVGEKNWLLAGITQEGDY
jgi:predicted lipid-binding transport protein (Tim44 family)